MSIILNTYKQAIETGREQHARILKVSEMIRVMKDHRANSQEKVVYSGMPLAALAQALSITNEMTYDILIDSYLSKAFTHGYNSTMDDIAVFVRDGYHA